MRLRNGSEHGQVAMLHSAMPMVPSEPIVWRKVGPMRREEEMPASERGKQGVGVQGASEEGWSEMWRDLLHSEVQWARKVRLKGKEEGGKGGKQFALSFDFDFDFLFPSSSI